MSANRLFYGCTPIEFTFNKIMFRHVRQVSSSKSHIGKRYEDIIWVEWSFSVWHVSLPKYLFHLRTSCLVLNHLSQNDLFRLQTGSPISEPTVSSKTKNRRRYHIYDEPVQFPNHLTPTVGARHALLTTQITMTI